MLCNFIWYICVKIMKCYIDKLYNKDLLKFMNGFNKIII